MRQADPTTARQRLGVVLARHTDVARARSRTLQAAALVKPRVA